MGTVSLEDEDPAPSTRLGQAASGRVLVAGWFSFEEVVATMGDVLAAQVACRWLSDHHYAHDLALAPFMDGDGVDWRAVDPARYSHLVFVCGPVQDDPLIHALLERFRRCRSVALAVSVTEPDSSHLFDVVLERDSATAARPDLSFLAATSRVPVVGVALAPPQPEYGEGRHKEAADAVSGLLGSRPAAVVDVDTDLFGTEGRPRPPAQVESLIARSDVVVTTRLHGLVLALRGGVPPVTIDPIVGGAKVSRQAEAIGWPVTLTTSQLSDEELTSAFEYCLTEDARAVARRCQARAVDALGELRRDFIEAMNVGVTSENGEGSLSRGTD